MNSPTITEHTARGGIGSGGKYYSGSGATAPWGASAGCLEARAIGGAVANDPVDKGCWGVTGLHITIDDIKDSVMAGFERTNFNFHVNGTVQAVASNYQLPRARV
jgi:hypothetical protein